MVASSAAKIVCLQDTKMQVCTQQDVIETLGPEFAQSFAFLPSLGASTIILLTCSSNHFSLSNVTTTEHTISAYITMLNDNVTWSLTTVYEPQTEEQKLAFLEN